MIQIKKITELHLMMRNNPTSNDTIWGSFIDPTTTDNLFMLCCYWFTTLQQITISLLDEIEENNIICPTVWEYKAFYTNYGLGRGVVPRTRHCYDHIPVYENFTKQPNKFEYYLHITQSECNVIMNELREQSHKVAGSNYLMTFEDKILMTLLFVISYPGDKNIAAMFSVSGSYVTNVIDEILPLLVEYFVQFIPNRKISSSHSRLHKKLYNVIDNTIHKTTKPVVKQKLYYNGHYKMHGRQTQLLIDYDGYIIAFMTNIKGKCHDALVALYNRLLSKVVGNDMILGDLGVAGVGYVVPGYKPSQVEYFAQQVFDKVTRKEKVLIESVNKFFKDFQSLNKLDTFRHSEEKLLACVIIVAGFYNLKRSWGYYKI
jgi:hypothetical protein